jgi:beta-N-acetylhexosaminidase
MSAKNKSSNIHNVGQLLIVGFEGTEMTRRLSSLLTTLQPAGVILFARNITGAEQTWRLLADCQKCVTTRLFACVDLEGGRVDRFRDVLGPTPSAADVFATGDRKLFRRHGQIIGECCRALGFNTDFAPSVDLAFAASRTVMASRAVSDDPKKVVSYAREFLRGLRAAGVMGCGKHFPGLGEANLDTHHELPSVRKSFRRLWNEDLAPYRALRRDFPMVMISHAAYPAVTRAGTPASLSQKWISGVLKKKIGYRGLIVSDDLEMEAVLTAASIGEAAVGHIGAGGDLCLICHREDYIMQAYEQLVQTAERDRKFAQRVEEAAARVMAFKNRSKEWKSKAKVPSAGSSDRLSRKLWEFGEQVRLEVLNRVESARRRRRR